MVTSLGLTVVMPGRCGSCGNQCAWNRYSHLYVSSMCCNCIQNSDQIQTISPSFDYNQHACSHCKKRQQQERELLQLLPHLLLQQEEREQRAREERDRQERQQQQREQEEREQRALGARFSARCSRLDQELRARVQERAGIPPLPTGWYAATDEATGNEYYYTAEGQVTWERPQ